MAITYCEKCKKETESQYKTKYAGDLEYLSAYCSECGEWKAKESKRLGNKALLNQMQSDIEADQRAKYEAEHPECPYCNSRNTKRISAATKGLHAALFGVFAVGKVSKQWHCNNCRSDF